MAACQGRFTLNLTPSSAAKPEHRRSDPALHEKVLWASHRQLGRYQIWCTIGQGTVSMRQLWCWRCKSEMPMLDEQEFAEVIALFQEGARSVKEYREKTGAPLQSVLLT